MSISQDLAIVIPTHNRQDTVKKVAYKLVEYFAGKCLLNIFILDSSHVPADGFDGDQIIYIHCPDQKPVVKTKYCADLINTRYPNTGWILYTPDDDLFIPNEHTLRQLFAKNSLHTLSEYVYVPSRYIMFRTLNKENIVSLQECWTHHCNIPLSCLSPREQLESYVSEGVASYWGLYSREAFNLATSFRHSIREILPQNCTYIIEDLSNILMLSFQWIDIRDPLICLRGDDRRFRKSKGFVPSWKVLKLLHQRQYQSQLMAICSVLRDSINKVFSKSKVYQSSLDISSCLSLIQRHVNGYREGRSRLYNLNLPIVLQSKSSHQSISFYNKSLRFLGYNIPFMGRKRQMIAIPWSRSDLDTDLYPTSHIFGDERVIDIIYDNKDFLFSRRDG